MRFPPSGVATSLRQSGVIFESKAQSMQEFPSFIFIVLCFENPHFLLEAS